jgi:prepilin-type N-terminal cleavage/methylation domain-containing protein
MKYSVSPQLLPGRSNPRQRVPHFSGQHGFSLIEVVLAVGIIAFCLVALVGLLAVCINTSKESMASTSNTMLFQKVVNQLRANASNDPRSGQSAGAAPSDIFPLPPLGVANGEAETFTVDSLDRFIADGAAPDERDATKVVNVKVLNPSEIALAGSKDAPASTPVPLEEDGKVAFVSVKIKSVHGYKEGTDGPLSMAATYCTEISLLRQ